MRDAAAFVSFSSFGRAFVGFVVTACAARAAWYGVADTGFKSSGL